MPLKGLTRYAAANHAEHEKTGGDAPTGDPADPDTQADGTLEVSLLYGDGSTQDANPDGVSYYTHSTMAGFIRLEPKDLDADPTGLTVTLSMLLTLTRLRTTSAAINVVAAFIGALLSTGFILLISKRVQHMASILIGGIMIGYVASAITDFLITFAEDADIVNLHGWSLGSFSGADWQDVRVSLAVVGVTMALIFAMSKQIGAFRLGEGYARSLGVDVRRFRTILILLSSILSATVTAFAGPISFVGVAAPYIMRRLLRTSEPRVLIPAAFLGGAAFTAACDLLARTWLSPTELNISTVTSLIGAPVVIWMLLQERGR